MTISSWARASVLLKAFAQLCFHSWHVRSCGDLLFFIFVSPKTWITSKSTPEAQCQSARDKEWCFFVERPLPREVNIHLNLHPSCSLQFWCRLNCNLYNHIWTLRRILFPCVPVLSPRPYVCMGLQRVPLLCSTRQSAFRLPADGKPVHRQGGGLRRGQLHLRRDEQRDKGQSSEFAHVSDPQDRRWDTAPMRHLCLFRPCTEDLSFIDALCASALAAVESRVKVNSCFCM